MARDWTIVGRFAPPMAQAAMQGANLADPSNPEGNKLLLRTTAVGLGLLSRSPKVAATLYGVAEGGAKYIDTGRVSDSMASAVVHGAGGAVAGRLMAGVGYHDTLSGWVGRQVVDGVAPIYSRYVSNPVSYLSAALFSKASAREALVTNLRGAGQTIAEGAVALMEGLGGVVLPVAATGEVLADRERATKAEAEATRAGAPVGAGDAMTAEQRAAQASTVSVMESLQRGTDAWVLADAQARLRAAGPSNETARAEFDARVKGIRNKAFRRKYAEWNNGADIDFELRVLRDRPNHEKAGEIRARHEEAKRMFGLLKPDDWVPKEGEM